MKKRPLFLVLLALIGAILSSTFFTVDESEFAIVTQFGKPISVLSEAGPYWKQPAPFQSVLRVSKQLMLFDPPSSELLTQDKKNILVDSLMLWRIQDPLVFIKTVQDAVRAETRLLDILSSQLGAALGKAPLTALISTQPGEIRTAAVLREVTQRCAVVAAQDYGIEVVDVRIKRLNFPAQNKKSVFRRMQAERTRIAKRFRSEGEEEAMKIQAKTDRERRKILSEAYKSAESIKGEADAKVMEIYANAFSKNPQFYQFLRTLQSYDKILDPNTTLILPADSELMGLINQGAQGQ